MRSLLATLLLFPAVLGAQDHSAHTQHQAAAARVPVEVGQDAYAAIAEIVAILTADPRTDWSKVDIEALRQHLRDMHLVTLSSTVTVTPVPGGAEFAVTGPGEVADAVRRMAHAHAMATKAELPFAVTVRDAGAVTHVRLTAPDGQDTALTARIRGLGFIGWVASGGHHQAHHLAIARGAGAGAHGH